jgi:hypothetical protein
VNLNKLITLRHRRPPLLLALLALALLLAQSAAQVHVYSHLAAPAGKFDFGSAAGQNCGECLASASLLSAAGSPDSPLVTAASSPDIPISHPPALGAGVSRHYAFRSRAPPVLL